KVNFPGTPPAAQERYLRAARTHLPAGVRTISLEQFEANLAAAQVGVKASTQQVRNDPPRIIMSTVPALLVRIDGVPSLRQVQGSPLLRVINTPALILLDPSSGTYYLFAGGRFLEAPALDAPWGPTAPAPRLSRSGAPGRDEGRPGGSPRHASRSTGSERRLRQHGADRADRDERPAHVEPDRRDRTPVCDQHQGASVPRAEDAAH